MKPVNLFFQNKKNLKSLHRTSVQEKQVAFMMQKQMNNESVFVTTNQIRKKPKCSSPSVYDGQIHHIKVTFSSQNL